MNDTDERSKGIATLRKLFQQGERRAFQIDGEYLFPYETLDIVTCPRCKGFGGSNADASKGRQCICNGHGELRKLTKHDGWYVTQEGMEFYY